MFCESELDGMGNRYIANRYIFQENNSLLVTTFGTGCGGGAHIVAAVGAETSHPLVAKCAAMLATKEFDQHQQQQNRSPYRDQNQPGSVIARLRSTLE